MNSCLLYTSILHTGHAQLFSFAGEAQAAGVLVHVSVHIGLELFKGCLLFTSRIHYNCVGTIEIPSALPLPTPDVSVNTRKGVVVNYAPCDIAI